jgi:hypothetical protein
MKGMKKLTKGGVQKSTHVFNDTLIKKIKGSSDKEIIPSGSLGSSSVLIMQYGKPWCFCMFKTF